MRLVEVAVRLRPPLAVTGLLTITALASIGSMVLISLQPIRLWAIETPMAIAGVLDPPIPTETAVALTIAWIVDE